MQHYYAVAEAGEGESWWISFPGRDGIVSAADDARQIVQQAQDTLESAAMHGGQQRNDADALVEDRGACLTFVGSLPATRRAV